jgi:hypothetical protein
LQAAPDPGDTQTYGQEAERRYERVLGTARKTGRVQIVSVIGPTIVRIDTVLELLRRQRPLGRRRIRASEIFRNPRTFRCGDPPNA